MEQTRKMTPKQHGAVYHAVRIGRILVNDHPEIADMYREGMSYSEIVENLDVEVEHNASKEVARNSIYRAIRGHDGSIGAKYGGLISDLDELVGLEHEHYVENGKKAAKSINQETGERYVVEGARKGGRKIVELRLGIYSLQTLWRNGETESAYLLSLDPYYQHQKGANKGKGDWKEIAEVLNEDYHGGKEIRSAVSVRNKLYEYRKSFVD